MTSKTLIYAATAAAALSLPAMADARGMRAVGSSTVIHSPRQLLNTSLAPTLA
jgi:hypothetical protein